MKKAILLALGLLVFMFTASSALAAQPTVNAGADQYVAYGQTITLQGYANDSAGGPITYSWFCTAGYVSNSAIAQPTYTAPSSGIVSSATCTLTAWDNHGVSGYDSVMLTFSSQTGAGIFSVQTNSAYIQGNQPMLSGNFSNTNSNAPVYVWFQWGTTAGYGSDTFHQTMSNSGNFSQLIGNIMQNTTYHYRAVAQDALTNQTVYGQDVIFYVGNPSPVIPVELPVQPIYVIPPGAAILGATNVSTALTNNFFTDSFFLPLLLIIAGGYIYYLRRKFS